MIIVLLANIFVLIVSFIFSWLPQIDVLPTIFGYDIDSALVAGIGQLNTFLNSLWPLKIMFQGALILLSYFALKNMIIKLFFGSRTPGDK